jgi:hypothetical protein
MTHDTCSCSLLFLSLSLFSRVFLTARARQQVTLQATVQHKTKRHTRPNHNNSPPFVFSFFLIFHLALSESKTRTTPTDTKLPPRGRRILSPFYLILVLPLCLHIVSSIQPTPPRSPFTGNKTHCQLRRCPKEALMYLRPPSCSSSRASDIELNQKFLPFSPFTHP